MIILQNGFNYTRKFSTIEKKKSTPAKEIGIQWILMDRKITVNAIFFSEGSFNFLFHTDGDTSIPKAKNFRFEHEEKVFPPAQIDRH